MRPIAPSDPRPPRSTITDRQRQVLDFIRRNLRRQGYAPSIREIGEAFGIRSPNGVVCHLRVLARKGLINRHDRTDGRRSRARSITVPDRVQSGLPFDAVDETVVLPVRDDSLARRQILPGDFLLVRETVPDAFPSGTTLVLQRGGGWILHEPQDGNRPTDGSIVGVLVGVLRRVVSAPSRPSPARS